MAKFCRGKSHQALAGIETLPPPPAATGAGADTIVGKVTKPSRALKQPLGDMLLLLHHPTHSGKSHQALAGIETMPDDNIA